MEIRSLIQFLQVAKDGSFTKAANNLYLSQPTLSKAIHNLEHELGMSLFEITGHRIHLTDCGEHLVTIATPIVNEFLQIPQYLANMGNTPSGTVSVGSTPLLTSLYLIDIVTHLSRQYPNINLKILERGTHDILNMTAENVCDIGLCMECDKVRQSKQINAELLFSGEIVALIPDSNPLSRQDSIQIADLCNEKFNLYADGHAINDCIFSLCNQAGFTPTINYRSNNTSLLIKLTEVGNGILLLPEPFLKTQKLNQLKLLHFSPVFPWNCYIITRKNRYCSHISRLVYDFVFNAFQSNP